MCNDILLKHAIIHNNKNVKQCVNNDIKSFPNTHLPVSRVSSNFTEYVRTCFYM